MESSPLRVKRRSRVSPRNEKEPVFVGQHQPRHTGYGVVARSQCQAIGVAMRIAGVRRRRPALHLHVAVIHGRGRGRAARRRRVTRVRVGGRSHGLSGWRGRLSVGLAVRCMVVLCLCLGGDAYQGQKRRGQCASGECFGHSWSSLCAGFKTPRLRGTCRHPCGTSGGSATPSGRARRLSPGS